MARTLRKVMRRRVSSRRRLAPYGVSAARPVRDLGCIIRADRMCPSWDMP